MPDLIETIRQQVDEERQTNLSRYREILVRADSPEPNDAAALRSLMGKLDFSPGRLEADLRTLKQAAALEAQAAVADAGLDDAVELASDAVRVHREETGRIADERKRQGDGLYGEFVVLQRRRSAAQEAGRRLRALQSQNRELFGLPAPVPEPPPGPTMTGAFDLGALEAVRQESLKGLSQPRQSQPRTIDGVLTYGAGPDTSVKPTAPIPVLSPLPDGSGAGGADDDWPGEKTED